METSFRIPLFYAQSRKSTAYAFHVHHREKQTTALLMPRRRRSIDQIPAILQPDDFAESAIEHIGTQCNPYLLRRKEIIPLTCNYQQPCIIITTLHHCMPNTPLQVIQTFSHFQIHSYLAHIRKEGNNSTLSVMPCTLTYSHNPFVNLAVIIT
jgi:hypothetical protein